MATPQQLARVWDQYRTGAPISDEDLAAVIPFLKDKVDFLAALGERFHLCWKELRQFLTTLEDFQRCRKMDL